MSFFQAGHGNPSFHKTSICPVFFHNLSSDFLFFHMILIFSCNCYETLTFIGFSLELPLFMPDRHSLEQLPDPASLQKKPPMTSIDGF
jgi:hypothetical protein